MKNKILENRAERFKRLFKKNELVTPYLAFVKIPKKQMDLIKNQSIQYLSKILDHDANEDDALLKYFERKKNSLKNITPTGMILPKNNTSLEFNILLKSWYDALKSLEIYNKLENCHTPAHLRVKWPVAKNKDLNRPRHAPEELHFDSWSGYSSHGLTFLLGVLGDTQKNRIRFFMPNKNYKEKWLLKKCKPTILELNECYTPIDDKPSYGQIAILDACTLHQTYRENSCEIRFSIDNIFRSKFKLQSKEYIEKYRKNELTSIKLLNKLGSECVYFFNHSPDQIKDTKGGSIDPTHFNFVKN